MTKRFQILPALALYKATAMDFDESRETLHGPTFLTDALSEALYYAAHPPTPGPRPCIMRFRVSRPIVMVHVSEAKILAQAMPRPATLVKVASWLKEMGVASGSYMRDGAGCTHFILADPTVLIHEASWSPEEAMPARPEPRKPQGVLAFHLRPRMPVI